MNLCVPTLNRYDLLEKLLESVNRSEYQPVENVHIIDNGSSLDKSKFGRFNSFNTHVYSFNKNLGVAASWNWFFVNISHPMLIVNDDLEFGGQDLNSLLDTWEMNSERQFFFAKSNNIQSLNKFSCFMPTEELIRRVGYFDELFYPAYYEDNDYQRRMSFAGIKECVVDTEIKHFGSATLKAFDPVEEARHHDNFRKLTSLYISKWGGLPGEEIYSTPYNGGKAKEVL